MLQVNIQIIMKKYLQTFPFTTCFTETLTSFSMFSPQYIVLHNFLSCQYLLSYIHPIIAIKEVANYFYLTYSSIILNKIFLFKILAIYSQCPRLPTGDIICSYILENLRDKLCLQSLTYYVTLVNSLYFMIALKVICMKISMSTNSR